MSGGRRSTSGRRRPATTWDDLRPRRRRLGQATLVLGVLVFIAALGSQFFPDGSDDPADTPPPASTTLAGTPAATGTGTGTTTATPTDTPPPGSLTAIDTPLVEEGGALRVETPAALIAGTPGRVIDGDTLDVAVAGETLRVRLYGVDTAERGDDCFTEATDRLEELAADQVRLLPDQRQQDRYGRELRYLFTMDGRSIDAILIVEGLGRAWRDDGAYRDDLIALEDAARALGTGCLWSGAD